MDPVGMLGIHTTGHQVHDTGVSQYPIWEGESRRDGGYHTGQVRIVIWVGRLGGWMSFRNSKRRRKGT